VPRLAASTPSGAGTDVFTARVTSGTVDANGAYPAVITQWDSSVGTWTDYGACKVQPTAGETLVSGTRYGVRAAGPRGSDYVYLTLPAVGGAASFSGCKLLLYPSNCNIGNTATTVTAWTLASSVLTSPPVTPSQSGSYFNAATPSFITIPSTGWYWVSWHLVWSIPSGSPTTAITLYSRTDDVMGHGGACTQISGGVGTGLTVTQSGGYLAILASGTQLMVKAQYACATAVSPQIITNDGVTWSGFSVVKLG
jgi:hypothetical protein